MNCIWFLILCQLLFSCLCPFISADVDIYGTGNRRFNGTTSSVSYVTFATTKPENNQLPQANTSVTISETSFDISNITTQSLIVASTHAQQKKISPVTRPTTPFVTDIQPQTTCYAIAYPIQNDPDNRTILFPQRNPGLTSQAVCPNNPRKLATWRCTSNGWSTDLGQPDLTDCVSLKVASIAAQVLADIKGISGRSLFGVVGDANPLDRGIGLVKNTTEESDRRMYTAADLIVITKLAITLADSVADLDRSDERKSRAAKLLDVNSNLLSPDLRSAWSGLPRRDRGSTMGKLLNSTEQLSFSTYKPKATARTISDIGNVSNDEVKSGGDKTLATNNFGISVTSVERNMPLTLGATSNSSQSDSPFFSVTIDIPASLIKRMWQKPSLASLTVYNSLEEDMQRLQIVSNDTYFNSPIFSVGLAGEDGSWMKGVLLPEYFSYTVAHRYPDAFQYDLICAYYDIDYMLFLQRGCYQVSKNYTHTVCACDHLTTFTVLFGGRSTDDDDTTNSTQTLTTVDRALSRITVIGCALSLAALFIFILLLAVVSRQNVTLRVIYVNFALSLSIAELIFLSGIDSVNTSGCVPVAVLLQFFFTATFMWSAAVAFYFVLVIFGAEPLTSRERRPRWPYFLFGCYFISATLIGATWITSSAEGDTAYGNKNFCWMNWPYTWFFISPIAFVLVFNFGVLCAVAFKTCTTRVASTYIVQGSGESSVKIACRSMVGIMWTMLMLCATWVLGFFYVSDPSRAVEFVFVILNSFQGVMVLVFYIVTNRQIRYDLALFCRRQTYLPISIRDWASYRVSSETWNYQDSSSRKSRASSNQVQACGGRELSDFSTSN